MAESLRNGDVVRSSIPSELDDDVFEMCLLDENADICKKSGIQKVEANDNGKNIYQRLCYNGMSCESLTPHIALLKNLDLNHAHIECIFS